MGNTLGHLFRITTFGESHGPALGVVIDGCPAGLALSPHDIQEELDRRKPGQSNLVSSRREPDHVKILSGIFQGRTLGTPIAMIVENKDSRSRDYEALKNIFRPGHADLVWEKKYGIRDYRGGGRASGRETVSRVMAGAVAKKLLKTLFPSFDLYAYAKQIGPIVGEKVKRSFIEKNQLRAADPKKTKAMENYVKNIQREGDSIGGVVEMVITSVPLGLGEPVFDKLHSDLGKALLSIPTVKGIEFGSGFFASRLKGSQHNLPEKHWSGGISGGISEGSDITLRLAIKPPSSIGKKQSVQTKSGKKLPFVISGRHDPCVIPRLIPVAESMAAIILIDHFLRSRATTILLAKHLRIP